MLAPVSRTRSPVPEAGRLSARTWIVTLPDAGVPPGSTSTSMISVGTNEVLLVSWSMRLSAILVNVNPAVSLRGGTDVSSNHDAIERGNNSTRSFKLVEEEREHTLVKHRKNADISP